MVGRKRLQAVAVCRGWVNSIHAIAEKGPSRKPERSQVDR